MTKKFTIIVLIFARISCFYSQFGQDQWLEKNIFKGKCCGTFIDIGAHDGITNSNTYFFERERKWTGLCIEPQPNIYKNLVKNRTCICLNNCVADKKGQFLFLNINGYANMLSGIFEFYNPYHINWIDSLIAEHGGSKELIQIPSCTLNDILEKYNITHVDYLSIDTEGAEIKIISSIDYTKFRIDVISIEKGYNPEQIESILLKNGFVLLTVLGNVDQIWCSNSFAEEKKLLPPHTTSLDASPTS